MTTFGSMHPLDVDLADLVDGRLGPDEVDRIDAHLAGCLPCRIKRHRLEVAPPFTAADVPAPLPSPPFDVPVADGAGERQPGEPQPGELWLAGGDNRILVLVQRTDAGGVHVVPVTLDTEAAGHEALVVAEHASPVRSGLVIHAGVPAALSRQVLVGRIATLATPTELPAVLAGAAPGITRGAALGGPDDPRAEIGMELASHLAAFDDTTFDSTAGAGIPAPDLAQARSTLIADLRSFRGHACQVRPLDRWTDLVSAETLGWQPAATIDEAGVVLVVFDTPHGLVDPEDFHAGRAVLTRHNATALVVLARGISDTAEVFDAAALHPGIEMPSGAHAAPRPLISGLVAFDAITKYLDQHSGARAMSRINRGPVGHVDVADVLAGAATAAVADAVRQGSRFRIAPKREGYESLAGAPEALGAALAAAFGDGSAVERLLALATGSEPRIQP